MSNPFDTIMAELAEIKQAVATIPQAKAAAPVEIINAEEICKRLAISGPTLIKWRNKKKIPFIHIGSAIRYNWPKVIEALENQKQ